MSVGQNKTFSPYSWGLQGLEKASSGFPQLLFLNACSEPPVAPVSIQVHWLPSKPPELSFPGVCLGNPPVSMLPSWYLSTAKFRNHCPHSLDEVLLGWGHLSLNSGCCAGGQAMSFCLQPVLLTSMFQLVLPRGTELGQLHCQVWLHLSPARPQESHPQTRRQPLPISGESWPRLWV